MSGKKYGDPVLGSTLAELKAYAPRAATAEGLRIEGPNHKVAAFFAAAGSLGDLVEHIETLTAERDQLRAEVEALRKDAERLRKAREILTVEAIETAHSDFVNFGMPPDEKESVRADAAIDAALAAKELTQ